MASRSKRITAALALAGAAVLVGGPAGPLLRRVRRSWDARVAVSGRSMEPTLLSGDWLLVDPDAFGVQPPMPGDLVVAADPRRTRLWLVKRVRAVGADGRLELAGDLPEASTDSRDFGPVQATVVIGRPWFRYWPPSRLGRVA